MDYTLVTVEDPSLHMDVKFKIAKSAPLKKLMDAYCKQRNISKGALRFLLDGQRISEIDTCLSLKYEEDSKIEVFALQYAG